jgi:hypothetical protein
MWVDAATKTDVRSWIKKLDQYVAQKRHPKSNMKIAYVVVWGKFSDTMRVLIEGAAEFK